MSTSGDTDLSLVANQIIEKAFHRLGVGSEGEAITARQYADGKLALNLLVKEWEATGHLWLRTPMSLPLVAGQAAYQLDPKALRVIEARRKTTLGGVEVPLTPWAQQQYLDQPNKTIQSIPTSFYYDPQRDIGTLYLWPTPSVATAAAMTVELTYRRPIEIFKTSGNDADLPQEWMNTLIWNLADELQSEYPVNDARVAAKIEAKALTTKALLESFDTEPASLYLQPDNRWC